MSNVAGTSVHSLGARLLPLLVQYRAAILTLGLIVVACGLAQVTDRLHTAQLQEPAGFAVMPSGDDVARLAPIRVTFATAPSERAPEKLLRLEPAATGSYAWLSPRTLLFQPDFPGLLRGSTYTVKVPARPEAGVPSEITKKFTVTGQLAVQQIIPGDSDTEVPVKAPIIVQFSRSVAPLTTLAAQPTDTVVTFEPALKGKGEWLNTSIYRFIPDALAPATTYKIRIAKGLTSAADGVLKDDFIASFTTIQPGIDSVQPDENWIYAGPWQQVDVTFNQPMDRLSVERSLAVRSLSGDALAGKISWNDTGTVLSWNPTQRLQPATKYMVTLERGLKGAHGGATANARTATFTTIPLPSIARTYPGDRERSAARYGVNIQFATPMDPASLEGKLSISGFTAQDLEGRVFTSEMSMGANVTLKPSTFYTVRLAAGATDRYGQPMGGAEFAFTTGALPSSVSFALPGYSTASTVSATSDPIVYFQVTNLPSVSFTLYPLTPDEGRLLLHDPSKMYSYDQKIRHFVPKSPPLRTWTEQIAGAKDDVVLGSTSLGGGKPLPRGYWFVHTNGDYVSQFAFAVIDTELVAKLSNNELLAWAIDHDTGKPLAGVTVRATGPQVSPEEKVTDASGLASFSVPAYRIGTSGFDRSYLTWIDTEGRSAIASTRWGNGINPYQFGLPSEFYVRDWVGHLYTDRPIYRPGETVQYKGIIRADDDAKYSLPPTSVPLQLVINSPRGQQLSKQDVTLNEFGSFGGQFQIPGDAPLGNFFLNIQVTGGPYPYGIASNSFLLAEFRTPEFQVSVSTPKTSYVDGDTIDASAVATFFFGGPLAGVKADWSALAEPYALRVKGYERYSFGDFDYAKQSVYQNPLRAKGTTKTDASGTALFHVPATLQPSEGARRFTLSTTITDENGQGVAGATSVTVHPASYYVGVRPAQYVATQGRPATIELVSVDTDGNIVGNRAVSVKVYDRQWITTKVQTPGGGRRYESTPKDTLLTTLSATTDSKGKATVEYRPSKPGALRIVAEITDGSGRTNRGATQLWVSGPGFASWQVTNDDTIKLVADKEQYEIGDTAEVLVPAPFAGATALVTIERGKVMTREVRTLATNSERLSIPIVDRSVPDVFVSVVLYRAPTAEDPTPRFKVGYVELPVSTQSRVLNVAITPDRAQTKPGDTVRYDIKVTDHTGKGAKAEVSVAVVDKAVLSLQEERGPDGLRAFWFERGLGVATSSSLSVSIDRWNDVVVEAARAGKGGAGAGGGLQANQTRQDFRNTAYWTAQLTTKDDGTASVDVKMPDNLTTWRMQVRAMSGDSNVGESTNELVSAQPLMIRSALPRFLRVGDKADLRVLVRNSTSASSDVTIALDAENLSIAGDLRRTVTVPASQSVIVSWPSTAVVEDTAKLTFTASGTGGLEDSLSISLPVYMDMTPETMATGGVVTTDGALEAIYLPQFADTKHGSLNVQVRSALVGSMADELYWLRPYPFEGSEHVASRLIGELGVRRAEKSATGSSKSVSEGEVQRDLAGLIGHQMPDGGWSWCDITYPCPSDPNVSGYVLLALGEAKRDGLSYDAAVLSRAKAYLTSYVQRPTDIKYPIDPSQKAFLYAALASAGDTSTVSARALFEQYRTQLTSWGRAYLILALTEAGTKTEAAAKPEGAAKTEDEMVRALLNDLATSTIASANGNHWEDASVKGSFVTNTGATGLGTLALARVKPDHMLLPQTVRWLVVGRGAAQWHTSVERALGILALTTYAVGTGELGGDYSYKVLLDDKDVLAGLVRKGTVGAGEKKLPLTTFTPGKASLLAVTRDYGKPGRLYYTLDLRYTTPAKDIEAVNRGFAVSHEYTALDDPTKPITSVKVGETVRVKVTILAPADRNYVTIEDLLPAGLEPVDVALKNVDPALKAKLEAERIASDQKRTGGYMAPWYRWYYSPWQQAELRDDRAVLKTDRLPKGVYEYVYYARATTPGDFFVAPAHAEETYFPEVFGRSDSGRFIVEP